MHGWVPTWEPTSARQDPDCKLHPFYGHRYIFLNEKILRCAEVGLLVTAVTWFPSDFLCLSMKHHRAVAWAMLRRSAVPTSPSLRLRRRWQSRWPKLR
jgi:hypothetical protein